MSTRTHRAAALIAAGTLATGTLLALGTHTARQAETRAAEATQAKQDGLYATWLTCIANVEPSDGELAKCDTAYWDGGGFGVPAWDGVRAS